MSDRYGWQEGFNFLLEFTERLERWDTKLKQLSDRKADYREYFRISFSLIGNPLILYDHNYIIIADSRGLHPMPDDTDWQNLTAAARQTKDAVDRVLISALQGEHFSSAYIRQRLEMIGWEDDCEYRVIMFSEKHDFMSGTYFPKRMQHIFQNCRSVVIDDYLISVV